MTNDHALILSITAKKSLPDDRQEPKMFALIETKTLGIFLDLRGKVLTAIRARRAHNFVYLEQAILRSSYLIYY